LNKNEHAGFAVLHIGFSYFETIASFLKGENSDGQSRIRFDYGLENVFASEFLVAKIKEFLEQNQNIPELSDK